MSTLTTTPASHFTPVARRVQSRLWWRKTLLLWRQTAGYMAGALVLLGVLRWLGVSWASLGTSVALLVAWAGVTALVAWVRRPTPYAALACWDAAAGRADDFANAWWIEQKPEAPALGAQWHLQVQRGLLPQALPRLSREVPLPRTAALLGLPLLVVLLAFIPAAPRGSGPETELTAEGQKLAVSEGRKLEDKTLQPDKMEGLTDEEKKEVSDLQKKVQDTAQQLQSEESKTARDVLTDLEKRARDAEKLAEKLGAGEDAWASTQMVAEMRKHADTAELGDAVASKHAENTAKRADELAKTLHNDQLTHEVRDRFAETFKEIGKQAQAGDEKRTVGQHVIAADKDLGQTLPKEAAREMDALADKMRTIAQREKAREQLEKLAQQLRDSASSIAGQGQSGMQQLAGSQGQQGQQGQQQQQNQGGAQGQQAPSMTLMPNASQMLQPMQMPGMSNAPQGTGQQGQGQNMTIMTPVPGSGQNPQNMMVVPGSGQPPKPGQPMLMVPIPGTQPNQGPPMAIMMGAAPGSNAGSQGGLQAGQGTAPMGNTATPKTPAAQQATVNAQRNAEGASSVRTVEGQARQEQSSRGSQAIALDAISAEENALDDAALPNARREQVRRYFTELRKRFEKDK